MSSSLSKVEPKLSYQQAMSSYVVLEDTVYAVGSEELPIASFKALLNTAARSAKKPDKVRTVLAGLNFYERMGRWFGLLTLAEQGVELPLFATADAARASMQVAV